MSSKKKIFDSIDQTIGNTPIVKLNNISQKLKLSGNILDKLEFFNPLGSVKDRIGLAMIDEAEKKSQIRPESVIIEATSGNTGIALAFICAARGYNLILTMPSSMSIERRKIMISDVILSISKLNNSDLNDLYNTEISKFLIEPIISKVTDKSLELLGSISIEDIYKLVRNNKNQNWKKKKVDFVI